MRSFTLIHLSDEILLRKLSELVAQDRATTAAIVAHIAEADRRRLFAAAGYPSMRAYCVEVLKLSDDAAYKRIQAARAAREFPELLEAMADGRLHLAAVRLLAPHLTAANAAELIATASQRSKLEIQHLLAQRFARSKVLPIVEVLPRTTSAASTELAPGQVGTVGSGSVEMKCAEIPRSRLQPHAPGRFLIQLTVDQSIHDDLRYAQELLGHAVPSGDVAVVIGRALRVLIGQLEKRKFAAVARPRAPQRQSADPRCIPAHVRRAVRERDGGQCTFVAPNGHRCAARRRLEFDHIDPVARGGQSTVGNLRLRCRTHNEFEAERTFGVGFMSQKRSGVPPTSPTEQDLDIIAGLRGLGYRAEQARRAVEYSSTLGEATLETRMRAALRYLSPRVRPQVPVTDGVAAT